MLSTTLKGSSPEKEALSASPSEVLSPRASAFCAPLASEIFGAPRRLLPITLLSELVASRPADSSVLSAICRLVPIRLFSSASSTQPNCRLWSASRDATFREHPSASAVRPILSIVPPTRRATSHRSSSSSRLALHSGSSREAPMSTRPFDGGRDCHSTEARETT